MKQISIKNLTMAACTVAAAAFLTSCSKDHNDNVTPTQPTYSVPATYNFGGANYSAQTNLLIMADSLVNEINKANALPNHPVTAARLTALFNNTGSPFNNPALDNSGLKLSDWAPAAMKTDIARYFDSVALYSQSSAKPSEGVAGVAPNVAGKLYLLSPTGEFYSQIVKKTIMGLCAYNIANVYMKDSVTATSDTATLAHYWDAAFGFYGVPGDLAAADFAANTSRLKYFASYGAQMDQSFGFGISNRIMNGFLTGRAAISHNDLTTMKAQAKYLIAVFDTLNAGGIEQEMKETDDNLNGVGIQGNIPDAVAAHGTLSESLGFVRNFAYNNSTDPQRAITDAQITQLEQLYDNANPNNPDFYLFIDQTQQTPDILKKTDAIRQFINGIYGFSVKAD